MPRFRKTSTQPKRKPKPLLKIEKPVYPEYIENFILEVESKTPFKVKIDQFGGSGYFHIGINEKHGKHYHCVWMVDYCTGIDQLKPFWSSLPVKQLNNKGI